MCAKFKYIYIVIESNFCLGIYIKQLYYKIVKYLKNKFKGSVHEK